MRIETEEYLPDAPETVGYGVERHRTPWWWAGEIAKIVIPAALIIGALLS